MGEVIPQHQNEPAAAIPQFISGQVTFSPGAEKSQVNVFILLNIAFFLSVRAGQKLADAQNSALAASNDIANALSQQLSSINFATLPADEVAKPDIGTITQINTGNQRVQAQVNLVQDNVGQINQASSIQMQQAQTTVQNAQQSMSEGYTVMQLQMQIVKEALS